VIILAFVIMVMSGLVIWIVSDKFNYEIKKLQGLATAAHTFSRNLFGNVGAAVALAISIMQRRPVRTVLTWITVLLLTFTILSFVAFQEESGINHFYLGPANDEVSRILVHGRVWKTLGGDEEEWRRYVESNYGDGYEVHGRYWKTRELAPGITDEELYIPIRHPGTGRTTEAGAIMSFDEVELRRLPELRGVLPDNGTLDRFLAGRGVYLSAELAKDLGAREGDTLRIQGVDVTCLGTFKPRELLAARQIDGSPFMPINFGLSKQAIGEVQTKGSAGGGTDPQADLEEEFERLEPEALEPVSPDRLIIAPTALAQPLGMVLKAIVVYPKRDQPLEKLANDLCLTNFFGAFVNQGGERRRLFFGERLGVRGIADVAIPLILGGLIVFSTMLGSIIDREREIYTFSALGLAPRNIAMLFFVEAAIYAVIGGFGGYLFSQLVTEVLKVLAKYGVFHAPQMNYSSTTVIRTILLVMATVIVSTIYPAIKAARRATADTMRHWHVPSPERDVCEFDFPFTISRYDITGIICFIREHFANHADRTVGKFAADHVRILREPEHGMAMLEAHIWLQPFDQGISQRFTLSARPSDIEEVCDIHVRVERLSGPPTAWKRSYTVFFEDMRSQFLLWRTLDDEARDHYLEIGEDLEKELGIVVAAPAAAGAVEG